MLVYVVLTDNAPMLPCGEDNEVMASLLLPVIAIKEIISCSQFRLRDLEESRSRVITGEEMSVVR